MNRIAYLDKDGVCTYLDLFRMNHVGSERFFRDNRDICIGNRDNAVRVEYIFKTQQLYMFMYVELDTIGYPCEVTVSIHLRQSDDNYDRSTLFAQGMFDTLEEVHAILHHLTQLNLV